MLMLVHYGTSTSLLTGRLVKTRLMKRGSELREMRRRIRQAGAKDPQAIGSARSISTLFLIITHPKCKYYIQVHMYPCMHTTMPLKLAHGAICRLT
jgi:hypothetical protein